MTTKRFLKFQFIFVILLVLTFVCNTFAWANRPKVTGGGYTTAQNGYNTAIELTNDAGPYYINGNACTAVTYEGTYNATTGTITYGDEDEGNEPVAISTISKTATSGCAFYYKTIITNSSDAPTTVSLYINGRVAHHLDGIIKYHISSPIIREGNISAVSTTVDADSCRTIKLFSLVNNYEIPATGTFNIEWSIYRPVNDDIEDGIIEISDIILTNN